MIKINFFETEIGMDCRAIKSGVYQVDILKKDKDPICLYIGESVWIASRCGLHIYYLFENPNYFGLNKEDLENEEYTLKFTVLDDIKYKKSELGVGSYKKQELEAIQKYKPLTQLNTSDRQIRDIEMKVNKVQTKMKENGFK